MRTYLYISDSKVGSYFDQMGKEKKTKLALRLGVNVWILSAGVSGEREWKENRTTLLEAVEKQLLGEEPVGPLESGKPWIQGTADVVAATFRDERDRTDLLFYFTPDQNHFLGLAGSAHHAIGAVRSEDARYSVSHLPDLLDALEAITEGQVLLTGKSYEAIAHNLQGGVHRTGGQGSEWTEIMAIISDRFDGRPRQSVSFLARRLTPDEVRSDGRRYTLATPLYIALN